MDVQQRTDEHNYEEMMHLIRQRLLRSVHKLDSGINPLAEVEITWDMLSSLTDIIDVQDALTSCTEAMAILQSANCEKGICDVGLAKEQTCGTGRPRYIIPLETLEFLIDSSFSIPAIAQLLGISESTVKRRMRDADMQVSSKFTTVTNEDLERHVQQIVSDFPEVGYRTVKAHLDSMNIRVPQYRVRETLRKVDPEGVLMRRLHLKVVQRRKYSVRAPMSLWHIDGYHKLIRWGLVIHGGIDGYSRVPVFMDVHTDNTSDSVLATFLRAVQKYGIPERVRSDKGGENIKVAEYMINTRGAGQGSHIAGRSVHNQRIERLWRDLWFGCVVLFHNLFNDLEAEGILNIGSDRDLCALHYVYVPRIQNHLNRFVSAMINRPLRTERNKTPMQLWVSGQVLDPKIALEEEEIFWYGVDWNGPTSINTDHVDHVNIPNVRSSMPDAAFEQLQVAIDPMGPSEQHGVDLFERARHILHGYN